VRRGDFLAGSRGRGLRNGGWERDSCHWRGAPVGLRRRFAHSVQHPVARDLTLLRSTASVDLRQRMYVRSRWCTRSISRSSRARSRYGGRRRVSIQRGLDRRGGTVDARLLSGLERRLRLGGCLGRRLVDEDAVSSKRNQDENTILLTVASRVELSIGESDRALPPPWPSAATEGDERRAMVFQSMRWSAKSLEGKVRDAQSQHPCRNPAGTKGDQHCLPPRVPAPLEASPELPSVDL
jgi:hypothetical protein